MQQYAEVRVCVLQIPLAGIHKDRGVRYITGGYARLRDLSFPFLRDPVKRADHDASYCLSVHSSVT